MSFWYLKLAIGEIVLRAMEATLVRQQTEWPGITAKGTSNIPIVLVGATK